MELYEIMLAIAAIAAALGGAFYEWRHTRAEARESLEMKHALVLEMNNIRNYLETLASRIDSLEGCYSDLVEMKPIAQRAQRTRK